MLPTGPNSLEELALYIAVNGFDFQVLDPPELVPVLRRLSGRLAGAPIRYRPTQPGRACPDCRSALRLYGVDAAVMHL